MNRWNIPPLLEQTILQRDTRCVYCGVSWDQPAVQRGQRGQRASWEHIVNDARIVTATNIARCCVACNASKGAKPLRDWLNTAYCLRRGITEQTVAPVVRAALLDPPAAPLNQ